MTYWYLLLMVATLAAEADPHRQLEPLKEQVGVQDALIAELLQQGHGHHGGGQQQAKTDASPPRMSTERLAAGA